MYGLLVSDDSRMVFLGWCLTVVWYVPSDGFRMMCVGFVDGLWFVDICVWFGMVFG